MLENMVICKPKKTMNGTYVCPIYLTDAKDAFQVQFDNSTIVNIHPSLPTETVLSLHNKQYCNFVFDLNQRIISIVKKNCVEWFRNNMDIDLVDDYYINPLAYDKKYGDIIKIKCSNELDEDEYDLKKLYDITITFKQLRFSKQKFLLECTVESIEESKSMFFMDEEEESADEVEEEPPEPSQEELESIKNEFLSLITSKIRGLGTSFETVQQRDDLETSLEKIKVLYELKSRFKKSYTGAEINELVDEFYSVRD